MNKTTIWDDIGFIISSTYRIKVLKLLEETKTPSMLSRRLNINKTHISRTLSELLSRNIILCLNPDSGKGRLYIISDYGKKVLAQLPKESS
jgi:predicted transcriptional regulator